MLKPAILYKGELERKFLEQLYSYDFFMYLGRSHYNKMTNFDLANNNGCYQYAIVDANEKLIGYFTYSVDIVDDTLCSIGLYSFSRGNFIIGKDVFNKMDELVKTHRRVEWRAVEGNPAVKSYDAFCKKHNGNKIILHKRCKAPDNTYKDLYVYEILKD